jgi:hypothetical protein
LADDCSQWTVLVRRGGKVSQSLVGSLALKIALAFP